jgi:hypothetical protein
MAHSLTRSGVQGVPSMPLHPRGPNPAHSVKTESIAPVYVEMEKQHVIIMPQYQIKSFNSIKSRSLASKCPQRISSLSALEWDVTYTPSWSKLRPEVSQYKCRIKCITVSYVYLSNKNGNCWRISYASSQVAECGL